MRKLKSLAALLLVTSSSIEAGCIGPVIMGECHGKEVSWDASGHGTDVRRQEAELKLAPRSGSPDEIPLPSRSDQRARGQGLDRFYDPDPQHSTPLGPQEYQGRFR